MAKLTKNTNGKARGGTAVADEPAPDEIELANIAGVELLRFKWPKSGGAVILRGDNGRGKTTALEAIDAAHGRDKKLRRRDGALAGHVKGFGVTIRVGENTRVAGECSVPTLEDRLRISELITGGKLEDPVAADKVRLKALLRVRGDTADIDAFYDLLGGEDEFRSVIPPEVIQETDLVKQAAGIKRTLDSIALQQERAAENCLREATGKRESVADVDVSAPHDDVSLQAALEAALKRENSLSLRVKSAAESVKARATAEQMLAEAEAKWDGPTIADAAYDFAWADHAFGEQEARVADLQRQLAEATVELGKRKNERTLCEQRFQATNSHDFMVASWRKTIESAPVTVISEADIQRAADAVKAARDAVSNGGIVRRAKQILEHADELEAEGKEHERVGLQMRQAAKGTDQVLTDLVRDAGGAFIVGEDDKGRMRIYVNDPKGLRGQIPFSELSPGEKAFVAIPVAIEAVGPGGAFTLDQEIFEGLSPHHRLEVINQMFDSGVVMFSALVDDGPLRAMVMDGTEGAVA